MPSTNLSDPMRPFVVVSTQRSGSTMLIHMLDQHPQVSMAGEVFKKKKSLEILNPEYSFQLGKKLNTWQFKFFKKRMLSKHLDRFESEDQSSCKGFKLMTSQIELVPELIELLRKRQFKFIFLFRENKVHQVLSLQFAQKTDTWVNEQSEERGKVLSISKLEKNLKYNLRSDAKLKALKQSGDFVISYEDILSKGPECHKAILYHLEIDNSFGLKSSTRRSSVKKYKDRISNYLEVKTFFEKQGLGQFPI